jgi:hypothetical protein
MLPVTDLALSDEILDWDVPPIVIDHETVTVKVKVLDIEPSPMLPI